MADLVIIPHDYERLLYIERKRIIPICITAFDRHGRPIPSEWFSEGVAPVRTHLLNIARYTLGDPWYASELAEVTIHRLWEKHQRVVRPSPSRLVLKKAMWVAEEMKNGGWRQTKYPRRNLALDALDWKVRDNALVDPNKYADLFERRIVLDWFEHRLRIEGLPEIRRVFELLRHGHTWQEIGDDLGAPDFEPVKRRFYRWLKKTAAGFSATSPLAS